MDCAGRIWISGRIGIWTVGLSNVSGSRDGSSCTKILHGV